MSFFKPQIRHTMILSRKRPQHVFDATFEHLLPASLIDSMRSQKGFKVAMKIFRIFGPFLIQMGPKFDFVH